MAISFNEYLIKDALYFNLTFKHQRDRNNADGRDNVAPFGTSKTIYLFDSSIRPYPANPIDSTYYTGSQPHPSLSNFIFEQDLNSNITIDDGGTKGNATDDKIYFNTVLYSAVASGKIDWFAIRSNPRSSTEEGIVTISDSVGIPGTNSLLTVSTSTVTTGQAIICWFNLSII
jgi:hypothetical protein